MADSSSVTAPKGVVYTFYSYKGGVGRSMALVNVGVLMALAGKRVLLVDWDLEAPGLEVYFRDYAKFSHATDQAPGIVDLLECRTKNEEMNWNICVNTLTFQGGTLDLISAGQRSDDYRSRVQKLDWSSLYSTHKIGNYVNSLRNEWRDKYDFILVDSRTGVTDIGDVCTVLLPDVLVLMFVTNFQNIEGIRNVMKRATAARKDLPIDFSKLLGVPLPARIEPNSEYKGWGEWNERFAVQFGDYFRAWLPKDVDPGDVVNKLYIPYVTVWSFGERIPVLESSRELQNPASIGAAYSRVATLLMNHLDWYSLEGRSSAAEIQGTRAALQRARSEAVTSAQQLKRVKTTNRRSIALSAVSGVVVTVGVLAAIAIPAYQNYTLKGQVAEGLTLAGTAQVGVAEYFAAQGKLPNSNSDVGLPVTPVSGKYVKSVAVQDRGRILIEYAPGANRIAEKTLVLTPLIDAGQQISWRCSSNEIDDKYLPTQCQKDYVAAQQTNSAVPIAPAPTSATPPSATSTMADQEHAPPHAIPQKLFRPMSSDVQTYYVVALTSNDCADANLEIKKAEKKIGKDPKELFPGLGTYEPQGYQCTLLMNSSPLPKAQAAELQRRAIGAGFGKDTWLMQSSDPYFGDKKVLLAAPTTVK